MNYYETMYIINSSPESDEIQLIKKEIVEFMLSEGADIYSKSDWGRTRLAYDIDKQRYGNYIVLRFSSKPGLIKILNEKFSLMDAVLSHLCIALDSEPERIEEEIKAHEEKAGEKFQSTDHKIVKTDEKEISKEGTVEEENAVEKENLEEKEEPA